MASFGWKSPFPVRLGGGAHRRVEVLYETLRAARPDTLTARGEASEVDAANQAAARTLAAGLNATARRVAQRDPRSLSEIRRGVALPDGTTVDLSPLERWERILRIVPLPGASERKRRAAVRSALVSVSSARRASVETAMAEVFGAWYVGLGENDTASVDYPGKAPAGTVQAYWPTVQDPPLPDAFHSAEFPGRFSTVYPWRSGLCHIAVLFQPPASADPQAVTDARDAALRLLDRMLPAWMSATVSQLAPGQSGGGFILGVSYLGLTAL